MLMVGRECIWPSREVTVREQVFFSSNAERTKRRACLEKELVQESQTIKMARKGQGMLTRPSLCGAKLTDTGAGL
jgi:hypothetical protein